MSSPAAIADSAAADGGSGGAEYRFLHLERTAGIVRLTLDRPPVNVLNLDLLAELEHALTRVSNERSSKILVLAGRGRAFCAGADVADHTADRVERMLELFHGVVRRLLALECPTLAVVHGATLGGGCELMLGCDVVLARADSMIGQPEIRLGVFPPVAAALLPDLVGRQRALELVLTGRTLDAAQAEAWGLVNAVYAAESFDTEVQRYVERLAALSGPVLRVAKRAVAGGVGRAPAEAIAHAERLYLQELMRLDDAAEGLQAFLEKRAPVWKEG
jgi:cyclohexa-1,5-dienecarbonyl-CoA hydratase